MALLSQLDGARSHWQRLQRLLCLRSCVWSVHWAIVLEMAWAKHYAFAYSQHVFCSTVHNRVCACCMCLCFTLHVYGLYIQVSGRASQTPFEPTPCSRGRVATAVAMGCLCSKRRADDDTEARSLDAVDDPSAYGFPVPGSPHDGYWSPVTGTYRRRWKTYPDDETVGQQ